MHLLKELVVTLLAGKLALLAVLEFVADQVATGGRSVATYLTVIATLPSCKVNVIIKYKIVENFNQDQEIHLKNCQDKSNVSLPVKFIRDLDHFDTNIAEYNQYSPM